MLSDPRIFNWFVVALFTATSIRWMVAGALWQSLYWLLGAGINAVVTMGFDRG